MGGCGSGWVVSESELCGVVVVGDGGGDVGGMVDIVEWFMDGACNSEIIGFAVICIFSVDKKEKDEGSSKCW